jgi:hypothetical protein
MGATITDRIEACSAAVAAVGTGGTLIWLVVERGRTGVELERSTMANITYTTALGMDEHGQTTVRFDIKNGNTFALDIARARAMVVDREDNYRGVIARPQPLGAARLTPIRIHLNPGDRVNGTTLLLQSTTRGSRWLRTEDGVLEPLTRKEWKREIQQL